ncbi:MAG: hypothetical protein PF692_11800 [Kiritimatiellae bacterium]|jgi:hypothetical protein|nr:hypothetical protein [Kiritimatiellia bacterium]
MMEWAGKIIDILGKATVWSIGIAFLVYKIYGEALGVSITNDYILSVWNIVGIVCLAGMFVKSLVGLYSYFSKKTAKMIAQIKQNRKRQKTQISDMNNRIKILNSLSYDQKQLAELFCKKGQRIMHSIEIGGYHAVWMPDMKVLIHQGLVKQINISTFEMVEEYYEIIQDAFCDNVEE